MPRNDEDALSSFHGEMDEAHRVRRVGREAPVDPDPQPEVRSGPDRGYITVQEIDKMARDAGYTDDFYSKPAQATTVGQREPISLDDADLRLTQEMARCLAEYEQARGELKEHYGQGQAEIELINAELAALEPMVEALVHGDAPLDKETAGAALKYLDLQAKKQRSKTRKRLALGSMTRDVPLGRAVGETKK